MRSTGVTLLLLGLMTSVCLDATTLPSATAVTVQAARANGSTPVVTPAKPFVGDQVSVRGNMPGKRRIVKLQRWNGNNYRTMTTVRTKRSGRYTFELVAGKKLRMRVLAPRVVVRKVRYRRVTRRVAVIRPRPQSATLTAPATVDSGDAFNAVTKVRRALPNRPVALQIRRSGAWQTLRSGRTTAQGSATFNVKVDSPGPAHLRVRVARFGSRPPITSPIRVVHVSESPIPTLALTTADGEDITSSEDYVHATMALDPLDSGLDPFQVTTRLRVRGNSTSWISIKRPYKVKLDSKESLAGMPASKNWALLANFYDKSMLRNEAAFEAARRIGLPWSPRARWVEVTLNGKPAGLYQLTENVEAEASRVDLPKRGVLLEGDSWPGGDPHFTTAKGLQIFLKDPDDEDEYFTQEVSEQVQAAEDSLYSEDFADEQTGYRSYFDVDTFVDWYLLNELTKNIDSGFNNSIWMSLVDGRVAMAAPWDFDQAMGNRTNYEIDDPTGWFLGRNWTAETGLGISQIKDPRGHWLNRMLADPWFQERVADRWKQIHPLLSGLPDYVAHQSDLVEAASRRNYAPVESGGAGQPVGPTFLNEGPDHVFQGSWSAEAAYLHDWLDQRISWMDEQFRRP